MNVLDNALAPPADTNSTEEAGQSAAANRVEGLLAAVVAACKCLVQHADLMAGLQAAVEQLGRLSSHDRAFVWQLTEAQTVCVCVAEWDAPGIGRNAEMAATAQVAVAVADIMDVWTPLLAGQAYQSIVPAKTSANPSLNRTVAKRSDVMVPIFVGEHCWGCIGLDNCTEKRTYAPAEIQALRGAAATVAVAVQRCDSEALRLAVQRQRADEAHAVNNLLEGVVQASRALLDATDFADRLQRWLAYLARAVVADAAMLRSLVAPGPAGALTSFSSYWACDGYPDSGRLVPATSDFVEWAERLQRGDWIWAHRDELQDPTSVEFWVAIDCHTKLLMPVVCDGHTVGWLGFEWRERQAWRPAFAAALRAAADGVAAALQRQQAVQQMLAEREQRIAVEQARADEAARHSARAERHAQLLAAVAQSAEELLAATDLGPCLDAVLCRLGQVTSADRLVLNRIDWTPGNPLLHGRRETVHEWTRDGAVRQSDTQLRRIDMLRADPTWDRLLKLLNSHQGDVVRLADLSEPIRATQIALDAIWALVCPVEVSGVLYGWLGFDYSTATEDYAEADVAAMQTLATTIADALWRQELEARALSAERARADESTHLAALLGHVVNSARSLIDADRDAFEPALLAWLGSFGQAMGAIRCTFYDFIDFEVTGLRTARMLAEWVREGTGGSAPVSFAAPVVIDPRGAEPWMAKLTVGVAAAFHAEESVDPMRTFLSLRGNATVVAVPLVMDGQPWGCLSFDHAVRRDPQPGELAVLQTAADTLAAVLRRNEALQRALDEREARLRDEQRRHSEMAAANQALRASLAALAGSADEGGFTRQALTEVWAASGASAAYLFRVGDSDGKLRMVGNVCAGVFSPEPLSTDPPMFRRAFELLAPLRETLVQHGRLHWRVLGSPRVAPELMSEGERWHFQQEHHAEALHALLVGERVVGLMGLVFHSSEPLPRAKEELIHVLCQPLTLATELARLARQAQRSGEKNAVLTERSRLAREIHDGIAHAFLAIQMQLDALDPAVQAQSPVVQALDLARYGLTEARRAVAALRPHELLNRDLPAGVRRLLAQLSARGPLQGVLDSPDTWRCLPPDVEDHLFRIVQEAANNALKHAQARTLRVELSQAAGETTVLIADDGVGFDMARLPSGRSFGLECMQQRAQLIGACIDWLSQPSKGTQVLVSWADPASPKACAGPRASA